MIVVKIEYDSSRFANHDEIVDLRDFTESLAGSIFELEQSKIDMRVHPYGPDDEFDTSFYFTFCVDATDMHHSLVSNKDGIFMSLEEYTKEFLGGASFSFRIHLESGASSTSL